MNSVADKNHYLDALCHSPLHYGSTLQTCVIEPMFISIGLPSSLPSARSPVLLVRSLTL